MVRFVRVKVLAAEFWMSWRRERDFLLREQVITGQYSSNYRVMFVKTLIAEGDEAGPAPVRFEYRGSISHKRGHDLTCFLHHSLVTEVLEG